VARKVRSVGRAKKVHANREGVDFYYRENGTKAPTKTALQKQAFEKRGHVCAYRGERLYHVKNDPDAVIQASRPREIPADSDSE